MESSILLLENVLEIKIWVLGMTIVTGVLLFLGSFSWQHKEICVCILTNVYIPINFSIHNNLPVY